MRNQYCLRIMPKGIQRLIILIILFLGIATYITNEFGLITRTGDFLISKLLREKLDPEVVFNNGSFLFSTQNDSRLIDFIQENILIPPSKEPYNLSDPYGDPTIEYGQEWKIIYELLGNKTNGFFIESGSNNGEYLSNTLVLERDYGWTGLLIEPNPILSKQVVEKQRKAWFASETCLSSTPYPEIVKKMRVWDGKTPEYDGKCIPFFSLLSAIQVFEIDFWNLDVDGPELQILNTIPFDSVFIKVVAIEIAHKRKELQEFLRSKGYTCILNLNTFPKEGIHDYIFVHPRVYKEEMKNMLTQNRSLAKKC